MPQAMACFVCSRPIGLSRVARLLSRSTAHVILRGIAGEGPIAVLKKKISKGELVADEYQMHVARSLQTVYDNVQGYEPEKPGLMSRWLGKGKKKKKPPKGLYLYGAVGGGKTMLMDLFYNCCQVSRFLYLLYCTWGARN